MKRLFFAPLALVALLFSTVAASAAPAAPRQGFYRPAPRPVYYRPVLRPRYYRPVGQPVYYRPVPRPVYYRPVPHPHLVPRYYH